MNVFSVQVSVLFHIAMVYNEFTVICYEIWSVSFYVANGFLSTSHIIEINKVG